MVRRAAEVEIWVTEAVRHALDGRSVEDDLVELKAQWPEPVACARQLAGHANAARGRDITWVIGVHERKRSLTAAAAREPSTWWSQVQACFEGGWAPTLVEHLAIPIDGERVVALVFETNRAPYVIKNPGFSKSDRVRFEVPWREGTGVRSASREDLLRILAPLQGAAAIEVLGAKIEARKDQSLEEWTWELNVMMFVEPATLSPTWIPFHRTSAWVSLGRRGRRLDFERVSLGPQRKWAGGTGVRAFDTISDSETVAATSTEVRLDGPGVVMLHARAASHPLTGAVPRSARIFAQMGVTGAERPISLEVELPLTQVRPKRVPAGKDAPPNQDLRGVWEVGAVG